MNKYGKQALSVLAVATALCFSGAASAQSAKQWSLALGLKQISPQTESGFLTAPTLPGVKNDVGSDTKPVLTIGYMLTDNIGLETFIAPPFKHDQNGDGSIKGTGKLGTVESLPATLLLKYRFMDPKSAWRPYVSGGVSYAYFQKERGSAQLTALTNTGSSTPTTFKVDRNWGTTFELGMTYSFNEKWFADVSISKSFVKTTSRFSTGQTIEVKLDPVATSLSVGYKF